MTRPTSSLRVGLIGCGRIAPVHLRYLQQVPGIEVVGFCDRDLDRAHALARRAGAGEVLREVSDLLRMPLDAVHVLTPPAMHAEAATAALESGVNVLVEKPMATTVQAAERMNAAARKAGRLLCVDHNRLFDPAVVKARGLVAAGAIGTLLSVEAYQGVNVQEGGPGATPLAMWLNLVPHPLYLLRSFMGEIMEWHACGGPLGELRAVLKGTQALGTLFFSPGTTPYLNALSLYGTSGTLHLDLNTMTLVRRRERRLPKMLAKAALNVDHALQLLSGTVATTLRVATGRLGTYPGIGVVIQRFYDAVRAAGEPPVTGADGYAVVELLEQIWSQAQQGEARGPARRRWAKSWLPSRNGATVLITGASGFLGRHVVAALRREGHRPRAMVHSAPPPSGWELPNGVEVVTATLGDDQTVGRALEGVRTVVHCAARVARRGSRAEFFRDNVDGTAHLLEAARIAGIDRFVHVSSIAVYGRCSGTQAIHEDGEYDPRPELRGAYTWSKIEADRLVQDFGRAGHLRTVIIRPGIIVGPDGPPFRARLSIGPVFGRLFFVVGRRKALLPLCHVEDVARAVAAAVARETARGTYNVVDEPLTQKEWLAGLMAQGASIRPMYVSPLLLAIPVAGLELASRLARRSSPTLSRYKIRQATESVRYDTSRARRDLGWTPEIGVRALISEPPNTSAAKADLSIVGPLAVERGRRGLP